MSVLDLQSTGTSICSQRSSILYLSCSNFKFCKNAKRHLKCLVPLKIVIILKDLSGKGLPRHVIMSLWWCAYLHSTKMRNLYSQRIGICTWIKCHGTSCSVPLRSDQFEPQFSGKGLMKLMLCPWHEYERIDSQWLCLNMRCCVGSYV